MQGVALPEQVAALVTVPIGLILQTLTPGEALRREDFQALFQEPCRAVAMVSFEEAVHLKRGLKA